MRRVLRAQDEVLREVVRDEPGTPRADAARALLADPERYSLFYVVDPVPPPASEAAGALRSGLLGLLVALAALALLGRALARGRVAVVALAVAALAATAAVGVAAGALDSTRATATLFPALLGLAALAWVLAAGRPTIRALLGIVIVVSPIRGAILAVAEELELPHALVIVNAIQPVLVAVAVAGLLLELRAGRGLRVSRPLALAAAAIAAAALLDLATQQSGASLFAVGLAQYLLYPVFALACWAAMAPGDPERARLTLMAVSLVVALSVLVHAAGLTEFAQAADADTATTEPRYGGATGSYLHASIFLGTLAPLWLAAAVAAATARARVLSAAALAVVLGALVLTFGRAGFVVAAIGMVAVAVRLDRAALRRLALVLAAVLVAGAVLAVAAGSNTTGVVDRLGSTFDSAEAGNAFRLEAMGDAVERWQDNTVPQKLVGEGLAVTGSAGKLTDRAPEATESYVLKLLVEVGVVGLLLVGAVLLWAAILFVRQVGSRGPLAQRAVAAAGLALSVDALVFPTLETQILGMTWWLLVVLVLAARERPATVSAA